MTTDLSRLHRAMALSAARALAQAGLELTLAVIGGEPDEAFRPADADLPGLKWLTTGLPGPDAWASAEIVTGVADGLSRMANVLEPDVVHLHDPALAVGAHFHAPVVASCGDSLAVQAHAAAGKPLPADVGWRVDLDRHGHRAVAALIAPGAAAAAATQAAYGLERRPHVVRPVPPQGETPIASGEDRTCVLTVPGWPFPADELTALNAAAADLTFPVMAAGLDADPAYGHVWALGQLDDAALDRWLAQAWAYVSMATYASCDVNAQAAARMGCALVLSDVPAHREVWEGAAILIPQGDAAALKSALSRLNDNRKLCARIGEAARERLASLAHTDPSEALLAIYRGLRVGHAAPQAAQ